jgi:hypothetical protein
VESKIGIASRSGQFLSRYAAVQALPADHPHGLSAGKRTAWNRTEPYGFVTPLTCQGIVLGTRAFQLSHRSTLLA